MALLCVSPTFGQVAENLGTPESVEPTASSDSPETSQEQDTGSAEASEENVSEDSSESEDAPNEADKPVTEVDEVAKTAESKPEQAKQDAAATEAPAAVEVPKQAAMPAAKNSLGKSGELSFNFSGVTWPAVLEWFADEADLALQLDQVPIGSWTFADPTRKYSVSEALDVINLALSKTLARARLTCNFFGQGIPIVQQADRRCRLRIDQLQCRFVNTIRRIRVIDAEQQEFIVGDFFFAESSLDCFGKIVALQINMIA